MTRTKEEIDARLVATYQETKDELTPRQLAWMISEDPVLFDVLRQFTPVPVPTWEQRRDNELFDAWLAGEPRRFGNCADLFVYREQLYVVATVEDTEFHFLHPLPIGQSGRRVLYTLATEGWEGINKHKQLNRRWVAADPLSWDAPQKVAGVRTLRSSDNPCECLLIEPGEGWADYPVERIEQHLREYPSARGRKRRFVSLLFSFINDKGAANGCW